MIGRNNHDDTAKLHVTSGTYGMVPELPNWGNGAAGFGLYPRGAVTLRWTTDTVRRNGYGL
jgi:hypothetical protein